jgi:predicted DNA-binding transcriptional regulator AlpA
MADRASIPIDDDALLRDVDVARRYGIARRTVWLWADLGRIPKPIDGPGGVKRWLLSEIVAHIRSMQKAETKELAS